VHAITSKCEKMKDNIQALWRLGAAVLYALFFAAPVCSYADPQQVPEPQHAEYRIAIHCSRNLLQLWRNAELIREYPIRIGKGGISKKRSGDHRTPVGDYEISWMASRASNKGHRIVENRSWCKANRFVNAPTGPSLEKLWSDPYGGDEAIVMSINYPNIKDRQRGYTGECIHMFPADARELYQMVNVGTPVKILP
jgi:L,D-peptidoglycan transpeptidase YkuD (ErfK/YbiS/YcfS/YnhG family)